MDRDTGLIWSMRPEDHGLGYGTHMLLPKPRGGLSEWTFGTLVSLPQSGRTHARPSVKADSAGDASLTLWVLHELSYGGFDDVDARAEWEPTLMGVRRDLEDELEGRLRDRCPGQAVAPQDVPDTLLRMVADDDGPSLAQHVHRHADLDQVLALLRQRSIYHLKEADPTSWVVPRLPVRAKAALMELQFDEYGAGDPNRLHSHLFAQGLEAVGLSSRYGEYVDEALPEVLDMNNAVSMFGLHRRLRGAAMGHLAAFEASSSLPSRRMVHGFERLGVAVAMTHYYREHVEADAVHEHLAARDICGTLAEDEPDQADEILFGAFTCLDLESRFAAAMLDRWGVAS